MADNVRIVIGFYTKVHRLIKRVQTLVLLLKNRAICRIRQWK